MALSRTPGSIQVNGAAMLIKGDSTDGIFANWQRVPGLANFTLPDETGSTNEIQLMDGSVAYAQAAGAGTITGSIGAITAHPAHQFLAATRRAPGKQITVTIIRPAAVVLEDQTANMKSAANSNAITFTGNEVDSIREGMLFAYGASGDSLTGYAAYGDTSAALNDHAFRAVLAVDPDTKTLKVAPNVATAVAANDTNIYSLRAPGIIFENVLCSVAGFGDGDFQAGSAVSANLTLQPTGALDRRVEWRSLAAAELGASSAFNGVFAPLTAVA